MKIIFKIIPFVLLSVLFFSCSEEIHENHNHSHSEDQNKISLSQFKKETNINDFKTTLSVPINTNGALKRSAELSEFVIDTVAIQKYISQDNKTTYSFRVYALMNYGEPDEKYNLVYTKENNVWEQSIIAFKEKVDATPAEGRLKDFVKLYDSRTSNATNSGPSEICIAESYDFHCTNSGRCASTGQCDMCSLCVTLTVTVTFCPTNGGGPQNPGTVPGASGGSPLNPFTFTPNMYENPVFDDPNYINAVKAQYFFEHLDYPQQLWATQTPDNTAVYNQLIQYLIQNNWTDESNEFVTKVLHAIADYQSEYGISTETNLIANEFASSVVDDPDASDEGITLVTPPSCESFNFTSPSSTINWQESAVKNIHFTVVLLHPNGIFVNHVIEYPNPILFGMPKNLAVGDTYISPGLAATLSALALNRSIKETIALYGNKRVSIMMVELYFESRLKHNCVYGVPGGKVNLHPQNYPTPTQYQTNAIGLGDCQ